MKNSDPHNNAPQQSELQDDRQSLTPLPHQAQSRCFGCGPANPTGLGLEFFADDNGTVVCLPEVAEDFAGHPGYLHGGVIATLLDEIMSKAVRARGVTAMTRKIEIEYLRPVPSGKPIRMEGRWLRSEGRRHWTEACILNAAGKELAQGKAVFVEVRPRQGETGDPRPDRP